MLVLTGFDIFNQIANQSVHLALSDAHNKSNIASYCFNSSESKWTNNPNLMLIHLKMRLIPEPRTTQFFGIINKCLSVISQIRSYMLCPRPSHIIPTLLTHCRTCNSSISRISLTQIISTNTHFRTCTNRHFTQYSLHTSHLNLEVTPIRIPIQEILQRLIIDVIMII